MPPTLSLTKLKERYENWKLIRREVRVPIYNKEYRNEFKEKRYQQYKKYYAKNKQKYLDKNKTRIKERRLLINSLKNKPCADCQGWFEPCQMDFDHRNPKDKIADIAYISHGSKQRLLNEITKCDVVCANCHRLRTWVTNRVGDKRL